MPLNNLAFSNRLRLPSRRITRIVGEHQPKRLPDTLLTHSRSIVSSLIDVQSECASTALLPLRLAFRQIIEFAFPMEDIELALFTRHGYCRWSAVISQ